MRAKKAENPYFHNVKLRFSVGNNSGSIKHKAEVYGFLAMFD